MYSSNNGSGGQGSHMDGPTKNGMLFNLVNQRKGAIAGSGSSNSSKNHHHQTSVNSSGGQNTNQILQ